MNDFVLHLPKAPVTLTESKGNMRQSKLIQQRKGYEVTATYA